MATGRTPDIAAGRLSAEEIAANFTDLHPPLDRHEALVEADRCYFCYDAPCIDGLPDRHRHPALHPRDRDRQPDGRGRDDPRRRTSSAACAPASARPRRSARRPACARRPRASRSRSASCSATPPTTLMADGPPALRRAPRRRASASPSSAAGPAGLACAHRLAMLGHDVVVFEARDKLGGLNEYGIAAYKTADDFAAGRGRLHPRRSAASRSRHGKALGRDVTLAELRRDLRRRVPRPRPRRRQRARPAEARTLAGVEDAVDYIAELRQAADLADAAGRPPRRGHRRRHDGDRHRRRRSKRLGAEDVTIVYRRGPDADGRQPATSRSSPQTDGVTITHMGHAEAPDRRRTASVTGVEFEYTRRARTAGSPAPARRFAARRRHGVQGDRPDLRCRPALDGGAVTIALEAGRIEVDAERRTSLARRLGRRRLRRRRRGPDRRRRRGRQAARPNRSTASSAATRS